MIFPAPQSICENAAQTAHRIDLFLGGPNRSFLTVSLDTDPENCPIGSLARRRIPKTQRMPTALSGHALCDTVGGNTFRKGSSRPWLANPSCIRLRLRSTEECKERGRNS